MFTIKMICEKIDTCYKIQIILDKDLAGDWQYAMFIRQVCKECRMSTRCQIGFYEEEEKDLTKWEALIYRHSDGYPGTANGKEVGVLGDIVPFLKWWAKDRGIGDLEYCSARLLQYLCNKYDKLMDTIEAQRNTDVVVTEKPKFTGTLGHGICTGFHGDIEYFYAIRASKVEVYEASCGENCAAWKLIKSIKLAKSGA